MPQAGGGRYVLNVPQGARFDDAPGWRGEGWQGREAN